MAHEYGKYGMSGHCSQHPDDTRLKSVLEYIHNVLSQRKAHAGAYRIYYSIKLVVKGGIIPAAPVQDKEFSQFLKQSHHQHILNNQINDPGRMHKVEQQPIKETFQYPYGKY